MTAGSDSTPTATRTTKFEAVFGPIYATNIPEFLDWHYTVVGQYTSWQWRLPDGWNRKSTLVCSAI